MFRKNSEIPFSLLCPRALLYSVVQLNVHCSPRFSQCLAHGEWSQNCLHALRKSLCNTDVPETGYASWNGGTFTPVTQIKLKSCPHGWVSKQSYVRIMKATPQYKGTNDCYVTTWMNLEDIIRSERSHVQETTCCLTPCT